MPELETNIFCYCITDTTLTVKTYDAATNEELVADGGVKTAYTIVKQADKTALADELTKAEEALSAAKTAGNYTEESVKALENTIAAAKVISENEESTSTRRGKCSNITSGCS